MKKNWMQAMPWALCAGLLAALLWQGGQLRGVESRIGERLSRMESGLRQDISAVDAQLHNLKEGTRLVADHDLEPTGIDAATRSLTLDASVTLRQWRADTTVILALSHGGETQETPLTQTAPGTFSAPVSLPLESQEEVVAELLIDSDGLLVRETVGGWGTVSMLLPVQMSGRGSGGNRYQNGAFVIGNLSVHLSNETGEPASVSKPEFLLYRNSDSAGILPATELDRGGYELAPEQRIPCALGDEITVDFRCTDASGMTYTFPGVERWTISADMDRQMHRAEFPTGPILTWNE